VPALVHVLKLDSSKDVKCAAANALGQIGGSEAEVVLERCIIYEKKEEVRDVAAVALRRLRDKRDADSASGSQANAPLTRSSTGRAGAPAQSEVPRLSVPLPSPNPRSSPFRPRPSTSEPSLEGPASEKAESSDGDKVPPPPPTPVGPS
jgi:hypothetical protein